MSLMNRAGPFVRDEILRVYMSPMNRAGPFVRDEILRVYMGESCPGRPGCIM